MFNVSKVVINKLKEKARELLLNKAKTNSNDLFLLNFKNYDKYITIPILSNLEPSIFIKPFRFWKFL